MESCPNCGQPVRSTARFCTSCGFRIPERVQPAVDTSSSGLASSWVEESERATIETVDRVEPAATWPTAAETVDVRESVDVVASAPDAVYAPPAIAADPIDEIVEASAGFNTRDESIVDLSQNKINVALYHIETLRQLLPDLSNWSIERAQSVNSAIDAMEAAIKGREGDADTFNGLRQTVAAAKKDPRDIDVMIALADRATDIEDLLTAHDKYSIGIRTALIELKPLAVEYVKVPRRRAPARSSTTRSRSTAAKPKTTTNKTASKTTSSRTASSTSRKASTAKES